MSTKNFRIAMISCLLVFGCVTGADAQQTISPEKKALIKEYFEITGLRKTQDAMVDIITAQAENQQAKQSSQTTDTNNNPTPKQLADKHQKTEEALRTNKVISEAYRRANVPELVEGIYYPVYDKYFTADDLKDLIAFYKSPTGKKLAKITPQLYVEVTQKFNEVFTLKIQQIYKEMASEKKPTPK